MSTSTEMRGGRDDTQYFQGLQGREMPMKQLKSGILPNKGKNVFKQVEQENMTSNTVFDDTIVKKGVIQKEARNVSVIPTSSTDSTISNYLPKLAIHNLKYNSIHENNLRNIFSYMRKTATVRFSPVIVEPMDMRTSSSSPASAATRPLLILATTVLDSTVWTSFVDSLMYRIW